MSVGWRVITLALSMVAMIALLIVGLQLLVAAKAMAKTFDDDLKDRARVLIDSGMLDADPGKTLDYVGYAGFNAMFIKPGRAIYTVSQPGQGAEFGQPEKDVVNGGPQLSLRTGHEQRVLAERTGEGDTLIVSKRPPPIGAQLLSLGAALAAVGGIGALSAAVGNVMVLRRATAVPR
jgi:two-component system sensor histidine kinase MprB